MVDKIQPQNNLIEVFKAFTRYRFGCLYDERNMVDLHQLAIKILQHNSETNFTLEIKDYIAVISRETLQASIYQGYLGEIKSEIKKTIREFLHQANLLIEWNGENINSYYQGPKDIALVITVLEMIPAKELQLSLARNYSDVVMKNGYHLLDLHQAYQERGWSKLIDTQSLIEYCSRLIHSDQKGYHYLKILAKEGITSIPL